METNLATIEPQRDNALREAPGVTAGRQWLMPPANLQEAMDAAKLLAGSNFVPKAYQDKPGDVLCAIQFGAEIGLPPLQALQGIAVVNGRPCVWGDAAMALVLASGTVEDFAESVTGDGDAMVATCRGVRRGRETPILHTFSVADARKAGLWGKQGPWVQHPKRMLQMRARGFVLRDGWADVLKGLALREEVADYDAAAGERPALVRMPTALPEAPAATTTASEAKPTGAAAPTNGDGAFIAEAQRRGLFAEASKAGKNHADLKAYLAELGIDSTTKIPVAQYDAILAWAGAPKGEATAEAGHDGKPAREPGAEG